MGLEVVSKLLNDQLKEVLKEPKEVLRELMEVLTLLKKGT